MTYTTIGLRIYGNHDNVRKKDGDGLKETKSGQKPHFIVEFDHLFREIGIDLFQVVICFFSHDGSDFSDDVVLGMLDQRISSQYIFYITGTCMYV